MAVEADRELKVADEVWIAAALLQKENPSKRDFSVEEIVDRARKEANTQSLRPGVYIHAQMHCVANRPPNPGRYRMLIETSKGRRRLFRPGDPYDRQRDGSKTIPSSQDVPPAYHYLLDWYQQWAAANSPRGGSGNAEPNMDPLLRLRGSGREVWKHEHADEFVRNLREGWE
jgi:hypothetical protein